ncbi:hypothetical protein [Aporhodopirellula aestuarii]|uniref:Uncharacterized protein n=1 Tax=Aporhodopirellula aestuarii TaxID=2950107 RepID=A0ABT0U7X0_9BACT|nr:hypothetical protein [Aporhodopirellula aestuarii]MCM2373039.1 hypothetical protein [Aporhodopirellula aestuarii]
MGQPDDALQDLIDDVINAAGMQRGEQCSDDLRDTLNSLAEHPRRGDARVAIAGRLGEIDSAAGAGFLAVWLGAGVEGGADPEMTARPILDALLKWSATVETGPDSDEGNNDDRQEEEEADPETIVGMEMLGQGLVAHVSRSPSLRDNMAADARITAELERVEHVSAGPMWVLELLRKCSGSLVVIHIERRRGFRVTYENISNCFHLFTLLQDALSGAKMARGKRVSPQLLAVANGQTMEDCHDNAWWHYGVGTHPAADLAGSVWGEASPNSIPSVDGQQVLLLWPPILSSRGWGAGFFGPFLMASPPSVSIVEDLSQDEVQQWWRTLELPEADPPPWWKFW